MDEVDRLYSVLADNLDELLCDIVTVKEIKIQAYEAANRAGRQLASLLQGQELLPRKLIRALDEAANLLFNEAPHTRDPELVRAMANSMHRIYASLLDGTDVVDPPPGMPPLTHRH